MNEFYFNGNLYIIQDIELHMRNAKTGLDELLFFKDPSNIQCVSQLDTIDANGISLSSSVNHHISFDCSGVSFANVHTISKVDDPDKAMTPPKSEESDDNNFIRW